jgi:polyketide synthase PksM
MEPAQLDPGRALAEYGLDSILVVGLTNQLRKVFPGITSTLFFEVQNINGLVDHLLETRQQELRSLLEASGGHLQTERQASTDAGSSAPLRRRGGLRAARGVPSPASVGSSIFDVAIIGLSGRYPGSADLSEFWKNLSIGTNCITEVPRDRWNWQEYYDPDKGKSGKIYTRWGGFLEDIDKFDPLFFKISPKEAKAIDPQGRLFLETCYHAIEDAGYTPENLADRDKVGVFVGVMNSRYTPQPLYYSIANRVSYLLNFQGPSIAVDTACSASLTAIHLALESIYSGLSECAIAGGVNLIVDPVHYQELAGLTMLSAGSQCRSFGNAADGFVDAEGVGAIVLKPLWKAERDGDHIYGVIKGSAINAGGRTNGYTVPSPKAQSAVVSKALQRAGLEAAHVSYIEAHGTGTALGDPIEIAGLVRAFGQLGNSEQACAIGSVKSNIGHCESAAGIAGLTKVLLQFQHKQLVPSLHADVVNPEIDFSATPFRLQRSLQEWQRPVREVNGVSKEIARIAGVSSFGAGGANAHIIVQEHIGATSSATAGQAVRTAIPLSARTGGQLRQKARDLLEFIRASRRAGASVDLPAVAYTLQVGREALEERVGFVVGSVEELEGRLESYGNGGQNVGGLYQGKVKRGTETVVPAGADAASVEQWITQRDLEKLLESWVGGLKLEWSRLHGETRPNRISLPLYPFARERYWRDEDGGGPRSVAKAGVTALLHPLLHTNVSDIRQQCYRSTVGGSGLMSGDHHRIAGEEAAVKRVLPAVICLELARAAVADATDARRGSGHDRTAIELCKVVWSDPAPVREAEQIYTALFAQGDDRLVYEIYSPTEDGVESIHCQGQAVLRERLAPARLDIERLKSQMRQGMRGSEPQYASLANTGMQYGPAYRGITSVYVGDRQVLAELSLPGAATNDPGAHTDDLILNPVMMDSALQAALDLLSPETPPSLPAALESLRILSPCTNDMFAWIRYSQGGQATHGSIQLNVDLCDRQGNVCIEMRGVGYEHESPSDVIAVTASTTSAGSRGQPILVSRDDDAVGASEAHSQGLALGAAKKPTAISLVATD